MVGVQPEVRADARHDDLGAALRADAQLLRHVAAAVGGVAGSDEQLGRDGRGGEELAHRLGVRLHEHAPGEAAQDRGDADRPRAHDLVLLVALLDAKKLEVAHEVGDGGVHRRVVEHADELPERLLVLGPVEVEELHLLRRDLVDAHRAHLGDAMEDLVEVVLGHRGAPAVVTHPRRRLVRHLRLVEQRGLRV